MKMLPALRETGKMLKKNGYGTVGTAATVYSGVASYNDARNNGSGVIGAAAQGMSDALIVDLIGWKAFLGIQGVMGLGAVAKEAFKMSSETANNYNRLGTASPFSTATHVDTEQSYTMRQAGLTQIQNNMFNTKKVIMGNEAMYMHR